MSSLEGDMHPWYGETEVTAAKVEKIQVVTDIWREVKE